ncbi:ubiquitin 3 binding protein But2 C-terminal domain-containing protein [Neohortaea acidophila]|uniref:Ubiquitin 3 binding protein But2 C-terminal domain-containing protein n=1 Tax=Neohortaea acidophila TaxID=245834 RepID=A0A6A6Q4S0_9PEZI|nr:ubiquitin 3 binding protein But2 C-terminal domain-containing protein [Neohortaea acidophila]KAF2486653.1 ubiquitin 3 binding protein But2 C-terminal domain-containing protein [Neohortaea acidophila]
MKATVALLALAVGSQALVARTESCCTSITAYGGPGGLVGQLSDGQNRIGDHSLPTGQYCLGADGGFVDGQGRGCIFTPPTTQYQCDTGANATTGFSISCNGTISYHGQDTFWACPTGQNGGYNIYEEPIKNEPGCVAIWLEADSCHAECPAPPPATTPTPTPTPAACPAELTGSWQFPHLIVTVNSAEPDKAYGTQFNGTASGTISTIFNFDIPASYAGKECSIEFLFPTQDQLETSAYTYSPGMFNFAFLKGAATEETTSANAPEVVYNFGNFELKPGTATHIGQCPNGCAAGEKIAFSMSAVGAASLNYFQDYNPCPIGAYVTAQ